MKLSRAGLSCIVTVSVGLIGASGLVQAGIVAAGQEPAPATPEVKKPTKAAVSKSRAKSYQKDSVTPTTVTDLAEEEDGMLGPRRRVDGSAGENRSRAQMYQQGQMPAQGPIPSVKGAGEVPDSSAGSEQAHDLKAKARAFVSKSTKSNVLVVERVGQDGIPVVTCAKTTDNAAGRIGDDTEPGSIFYVMRDNKPFKVRCAP